MLRPPGITLKIFAIAASRKAGIARFFDIDAVLSEHAAKQLGEGFTCRSLGNILVPGKDETVRAVQFLGKTSLLPIATNLLYLAGIVNLRT